MKASLFAEKREVLARSRSRPMDSMAGMTLPVKLNNQPRHRLINTRKQIDQPF